MARVGRPTKLTEDVIKQAQEYLDSCKGVERHTLLPTIEGLSLKIHIWRDTIYDWENVPELGEDATEEAIAERVLRLEFSNIVKELRSAQAEKLMQNSLQTHYNPMIAKLLLSKHGYVEKSEQDITSKGEQIAATVDPAKAQAFAEFLKEQTKD